jgi:hypothetical protein
MKVQLVRTHQNPPKIRRADIRRDWMDDTYNKHAYRCLPLSEANTYGWELLLQEDVIVQWDGGHTVPYVVSGGTAIHDLGNGETYSTDLVIPSVVGIMSFVTGWSFSTPKDHWTWISGSPNYFVDGAVPLTAAIPSDWWPDEFNMNWKITKVGEPVVFPKGMPFMFFNFYERPLLSQVEFEIQNYWDYPELMNDRASYGDAKMKKLQDEPWKWMNGIRSGLNEKGERIGPKYEGSLSLEDPSEKN